MANYVLIKNNFQSLSGGERPSLLHCDLHCLKSGQNFTKNTLKNAQKWAKTAKSEDQ